MGEDPDLGNRCCPARQPQSFLHLIHSFSPHAAAWVHRPGLSVPVSLRGLGRTLPSPVLGPAGASPSLPGCSPAAQSGSRRNHCNLVVSE